MDVKLTAFLICFAAVFAPSFSFNPFSLLKGVVRNEEAKSNLRNFQLKNTISSMLLRGQPVINMGMSDDNDKLQNQFSWKSCGPANQLMDIKKLMLKPSPLSFPGTFTFGFDIVFHDNIEPSDEVVATLDLRVQVRDSWIKIPCLGSIGSCTYKNICEELSGVTCPSDITDKGIPCNCPFRKGEYKLPEYNVTVLSEVFMAGNYQATANLTSSTKGHVGCYQLAFTVET